MRLGQRFGFIAVFFVGAAFAQGEAPAEPVVAPPVPVPFTQPAATDPVHDELRALQATMEDALNRRDLDALLAQVDEDVVFTTMNGDVARGKEAIRQYFTRMMDGPDKIVDSVRTDFVPDALAVFYGPDVAVAVGKTDDHYQLTDGREFDIHARWTATLVRQDGRWRVGAFHYSTNVFDNPILDLQRKYLVMAGAGGALVLALIGFGLGRSLGRKSRVQTAG